jgi:hypothetical protein
MLAVFGMVFMNCENGNGTTNHNNDENLSVSIGINEIGGRTFFPSDIDKITFSETAYNDANGTFIYTSAYGVWDEHNYEHIFEDVIITGNYTWNTKVKKVKLNYKNICYRDGMIPFVCGFGIAVYYNRILAYSISTDETALFFEYTLPANEGINELSGQTYYATNYFYDDNKEEIIPIKDTNRKYVFTPSGYTYTDLSDEILCIITGSYAYNTSEKKIWLRTETINGKSRDAYYMEQTAPCDHDFQDDNAYRAALTNYEFTRREWSIIHYYNSTDKTLDCFN